MNVTGMMLFGKGTELASKVHPAATPSRTLSQSHDRCRPHIEFVDPRERVVDVYGDIRRADFV